MDEGRAPVSGRPRARPKTGEKPHPSAEAGPGGVIAASAVGCRASAAGVPVAGRAPPGVPGR